jgi:hypothetical protein
MPNTSPSLTWIEIYQYDLHVISCYPNFWLPFIFIHADRRSAKYCNKLVMASLNQRQEVYALLSKNVAFFCSGTWPQKVENGCGGSIVKMKSAAYFTYSQNGRRGLGQTSLELRKGCE